ncbi:ParA family protein [Microvirga alba]|uniref:ParA family protein n=1 Tax=Microvirga alba TaxID=2791025 RepID=A0A931FRC9_9HYPH|nr:ParA family protein [Microvirga alba]MBF9235627.1 ParA family protein [Microvirga alba]
MPVISMVSSKGGAGKTTAAVVLASVYADAGGSVALLDADPNQPIAAWARDPNLMPGEPWAQNPELPPTLRVIPNVTENNIIETIEEESGRNQFVLVDLEGSANIALSYAMGQSDVVVIPVQASQLDADEAAKTIKLVYRQKKTIRADIDCAVVWQRANAAILTQSAKAIQQQFEEANIPILETKLIEREAYKALFAFGTTLNGLEGKVAAPQLDKAKVNAAAFAKEVVERWKVNHGRAA